MCLISALKKNGLKNTIYKRMYIVTHNYTVFLMYYNHDENLYIAQV